MYRKYSSRRRGQSSFCMRRVSLFFLPALHTALPENYIKKEKKSSFYVVLYWLLEFQILNYLVSYTKASCHFQVTKCWIKMVIIFFIFRAKHLNKVSSKWIYYSTYTSNPHVFFPPFTHLHTKHSLINLNSSWFHHSNKEHVWILTFPLPSSLHVTIPRSLNVGLFPISSKRKWSEFLPRSSNLDVPLYSTAVVCNLWSMDHKWSSGHY